MTTATIHCVNVIQPRRAGARTHAVAMKLVLASSEDEAMRKVAADCADDELVSYRNAFEAQDVFTWSYQYWTRDDVEGCTSARRARAVAPLTARDIARFWSDVVPYFKLDSSFDYDGQPDIMLGYLKAFDRATD